MIIPAAEFTWDAYQAGEYGDHAIVHGDCREVLPKIPNNAIDLVLTDPPYHHEHMGGEGFGAARKFYSGGKLDGMNDFNLSQYEKVLMVAAPMLIAFHSRDLIPDYTALARRVNRKYDLHVWHKTNAIPFTANTWKSDLEYIALIWDKKPGWKQYHQKYHSKCWSSATNPDPLHPTAKPIPLLQKYIAVLDVQTICDPFLGSGTTLVAAKNLGRRAIGIEINLDYCRIAEDRLRQEVMAL
jgi:DNA modification methylase